jgi:transcriptional regulator of acetoin/glycerol metabolism
LYYRLNGLVVRLPALRERSDLEVVAQRVLRAVCPQGAPQISPAVMALFKRYAWPGNIRQLANVLRTAAVMAAGEPQITEQHLPDDFLEDVQRMPAAVAAADPPAALAEETSCEFAGALPMNSTAEPAVAPAPAEAAAAPDGEPPRTLAEAEIHTIRQALAAAAGNISEASKRLGISRNTIYRKLRWGKATA